MQIENITSPEFLNTLSDERLEELAEDIRFFLLMNIAKTGGHLSSNLGIVELTIALHYIFDSPKDKLIFDVGHQSYVHKILTGRANQFHKLRQYQGLSGFQKRKESIHDVWESGHSSTSISAALGFAISRDLNKEKYEVIAIIGDGSLTGGLALEGLNNIGEYPNTKVIVVLNDNEMSISKNIGGINNYLSKLRSSDGYTNAKAGYKDILNKSNVGSYVYQKSRNIKEFIKKGILNDGVFGDFGLDYIGPIDGHDISALKKALAFAKNHEKSIVIHVKTKKGKGYKYCEDDELGKWHGVEQFDVISGKNSETKDERIVWSEIVAKTVEKMMGKDENILAITPAMKQGSKLENIFDKYPNRSFDVGIAEEHAACFAAALALANKKPFLAIYSTFLQRSYDQVLHDIARQKAHVVCGVDRAGLVGKDGETHHGVFDIAYLNHIPNIIIAAPMDAIETQNMLYTAFYKNNLPYFIRFSRKRIEYIQVDEYQEIKVGSWNKILSFDNSIGTIISYGIDLFYVVKAIKFLGLSIDVINARYIKPMDYTMLEEIYNQKKKILIYETSCKIGGLGSSILTDMADNNINLETKILGIEDHFVEQGLVNELLEQENLDINSLIKEIKEFFK